MKRKKALRETARSSRGVREDEKMRRRLGSAMRGAEAWRGGVRRAMRRDQMDGRMASQSRVDRYDSTVDRVVGRRWMDGVGLALSVAWPRVERARTVRRVVMAASGRVRSSGSGRGAGPRLAGSGGTMIAAPRYLPHVARACALATSIKRVGLAWN